MKMTLVPGYRSLFGEPDKTYGELLADLPSDIIIAVAIMLNNELNAPVPSMDNQERLRNIISRNFTQAQKKFLDWAFHRYSIKAKGNYTNYVFARRYLIALILKELNRNAIFEFKDSSPDQEYNFLLAYLLVIDEVNERDSTSLREVINHTDKSFHSYRMLWSPLINQYQFNEHTNIPFEFFKLLCFLKYAYQNYRPFLKEYIGQFGFNTLGQFTNSLYQISAVSIRYNDKEVLSKLNYITPVNGVNDAHLQAMCINKSIGNAAISILDIKKAPLYQSSSMGYMIIDEHIYNKKFYNGPFFELRSNTSLASGKKFNSYSSEISKNVLEALCFKLICSQLKCNKYDVLHFDDGSDDIPDCYQRKNKNIFLLKFKGYLMSEGLSEKPDFDQIKKYIDERFIKNNKGKNKGIMQLINQIQLLYDNHYDFDPYYKSHLHGKHNTIYPVICHNEYYFGMPGINDYLNGEFVRLLKPEWKERFTIKNVTMINLELLFDMACKNYNFDKLAGFIDRYWKMKADLTKKIKKQVNTDIFLQSHCSFDEIFQTKYIKDLLNVTSGNKIFSGALMDMIGITQQMVEEEV